MAELLLRTSDHQSPDIFVERLPELLGCCGQWEKRYSDNSPGGEYLRSFVLGVEVTVTIADDSEFPDWDIWMRFDPQIYMRQTPGFLDDVAECVARVLTLKGYEVIRPLGGGKKGGGAIMYEKNKAEGVAPHERILTKRI